MAQILIADDNEIARGIVSELLQNHDGWNVCAQVANGREAVAKAVELKPDVAILDLAMPEVDGLTAAREIAKAVPSVTILIYTLHDGDLIDLEAKKAGVRRIVPKMGPPENLVLAVEELLKNQEKEVKAAAPAVEVISPGPLGDINTSAVQARSNEPPPTAPNEPDPSGNVN
jgi:DNA-binding NarL/FixJ family response regulator